MDNPESGSGEVFDIERILRLVELMKEHDLSEIDLRHSDQRIRLRRGGEPIAPSLSSAPAPPALPSATQAAQQAGAPAAASAESESKHIITMKSPMVGTFYRKANPTAEDFVKVGDRVEAETTVVCIIEAMKVFNEIPAEVSGRIVAILVDNEEPVEFGKPLFKIDTSL
jgi:acetyl-CoA carboxylase biotin carboxyl carrier protein